MSATFAFHKSHVVLFKWEVRKGFQPIKIDLPLCSIKSLKIMGRGGQKNFKITKIKHVGYFRRIKNIPIYKTSGTLIFSCTILPNSSNKKALEPYKQNQDFLW